MMSKMESYQYNQEQNEQDNNCQPLLPERRLVNDVRWANTKRFKPARPPGTMQTFYRLAAETNAINSLNTSNVY